MVGSFGDDDGDYDTVGGGGGGESSSVVFWLKSSFPSGLRRR